MAGITATGLGGSGLDVNSLVSQLVAAERAPLQQRISRVETEINTQLSAFSTVRAGLSNLQTALAGLKTAESMQVRRANSGDTTVFRATASSSAAPASYSVEVTQLAAANRKASLEQAGGSSSVVGAGTLTFTQNGQSFSVDLTATTTLAQLRDAINAASANTGVQAAILATANGSRLTLTSTRTGAANGIELSTSNASTGLSNFVLGFTNTVNAQDASVKIDGFTVTSSTNTISGAIDGVSLDLVTAKAGTTISLAVTNDTQAVKDKINKFVTDYNAFQTQAARLRAYDPKTNVGGPLIGDSSLRGIEASLRREITGITEAAAANTNSLSSIGIRFGSDGKLTVNDTQLTDALNNRFDQVATMFTTTGGLVARLNSVIDSQISSEGVLTARTNSLDARKKTVAKDKEAMEARLLLIEKRYRAQFINLDKMLSEMQGTSSYIAKIGSG